MKFSGKMLLMTILKVSKRQGFSLSIYIFGITTGGGQINPHPSLVRINVFGPDQFYLIPLILFINYFPRLYSAQHEHNPVHTQTT